MLVLTTVTDPCLYCIPPDCRSPTLMAIKRLCSLYPPEPDPETQGCVVVIEPGDTLRDLNHVTCKELTNSLEGVYRDGCCLIGVIIWGNCGAGVTIVCPDKQYYPTDIIQIMKEQLS